MIANRKWRQWFGSMLKLFMLEEVAVGKGLFTSFCIKSPFTADTKSIWLERQVIFQDPTKDDLCWAQACGLIWTVSML